MEEARHIKKLYYSISEVSEITGLKQYVLRYWETEFSQLRPNKNRAGNRTYKPHDVALILNIKSLLYDRKFTIKGAKQHLKSLPENGNKPGLDTKIVKMVHTLDIKVLKRLKKNLNDVIISLEKYKN